jgi:proton-translocating NADH-quinone oxidoreductase chain L
MSLSAFVSMLQAHGEHAAEAASSVSPTLVWLVPLLPVFGFLFQVFIGRKLPKPIAAFVSCGAVFASCVIAWTLFFKVRATGTPIVADIGPWIQIPGLKDGFLSVIARHKLVVDQLTCVMILVVTNIGFLIHVYSTGYMAEEKRFARYFSYLNLFTGFMLILVMASNVLLMFVGWEGVGLCSYLLIGFWFEKKENAAAGMKAFIVNRVGDLAFTIGALTLFVFLGRSFGVWTIDFEEMKQVILAHKDAIPMGLATFIGIMLFIGATGKSAQVPLYVWLPDAMAGPTPVSALIHAATMVTAGVYMIARLNFLFSLSPTAMAVVTGIGALTAIFAGSIGVAQNDIKKVLAYSTVSQLGFMFMGVGVGAFAAGVFHLFTHAFFKACLFLGSGSVIHGMGGEQDIRKMGGLKAKMPITFWTFLIASLALSGVPPLAGFFSKDEILWQAWSTKAFAGTALGAWYGKLIWLTGATAAACTAFYMTRLVIKTFLDRPKWGAATAFSGGGLPDWMDEEEKKKEPEKKPPKSGTGPDGMPAWMEDDPVGGSLPADESMLDLGNVRKKPKKDPEPPPPPPAKPVHDDESHPAIPESLLQDESLLDLGAVGRKPKGSQEDHGHASDLPHDESMLDLGKVGGSHPGAPAHDADDAHAAAPHDAGHGHDSGHGHGGHGHGEPHESPFSMWIALAVLAAGSVLVGFLGVPAALGGHNRFEHWLSPVTVAHAEAEHAEKGAHAVKEGEPEKEEHHNPMEYVLMLVSIGAAFGGIGIAWYIYGKRQGAPALEFTEKHKELYELVRDKYRVDELYEAAIVNPLLNLNEGTCRFDNEVVDGAVNGAAWVGKKVSGGTGLVDNEVVDAAVNGAAVATQIVARRVRRAQTGNIKEYLTFALVGGLFVIALFCLYLTREPLLAKIRELFGS